MRRGDQGKTSQAQRQASHRWLSKPGVREAVNEKAKARMRRHRQRVRGTQGAQSYVPTARFDVEAATEVLQTLSEFLETWQEWCPIESEWEGEFKGRRSHAYEGGEETIETFWNECREHLAEGREALQKAQKIAQIFSDDVTFIPRGAITQLPDVLCQLSTELKFTEMTFTRWGVGLESIGDSESERDELAT